MGILDALTGRTKVLRYRMVFGSGNNVGVHIEPCVPQIAAIEYIRLWASYQAKIIYILNSPENHIALASVAKVADEAITSDTDCFERAGLAEVIQFAHEVPSSGTTFNGEFYAKGSLDRRIWTRFPFRMNEQQVVYSGLALMQYVISINSSDDVALDLLTKTARHFVALYSSGMRAGLQAVVQIPTLADMQAVEEMAIAKLKRLSESPRRLR